MVDGQEADQGDDLIQSQEAGEDLKVLDGGDLILGSVVDGLGAHPNPGNYCLKFHKSVKNCNSEMYSALKHLG